MYSNHMPNAARPREILHILFKHKRKILMTFAIVMSLVLIVSILATPIYQSSASLLVKAGREYRAKPEIGDGPDQMVVDREQIINSEIEMILNKEVISQVIKSIGLTNIYPQFSAEQLQDGALPDAALSKFMRSLSVVGVPKSNIISLSFDHPDPKIAKMALSILIEKFKEKHLEVYSDPVSPALQKQLAEYARMLKSSEDSLEAFRQKYRIYTIDEQRKLLLEQQAKLDTSSKMLDMEEEALERKVLFSRAQLKTMSIDARRYTQTERDKIIVDAQTRLLVLRLKEQELLNRDYRPESRALSDVKKEIELVTAFLVKQEVEISKKVRTGNPVYQQLESEMLKAESELASRQQGLLAAQRNLEMTAAAIQELDKRQNELHALERDVTVKEKNYLTYQEKYEDARISADLNQQKIANISVVQSPDTTNKPIRPKTLINIVVGTLMAGLTALITALLSEYLSPTLSTPEQVVRKLGIPVLASVRRRL